MHTPTGRTRTSSSATPGRRAKRWLQRRVSPSSSDSRRSFGFTAANNAAVAIADGRFREATELDEQARRLGERAQPHDAIAVDVLHRFLLADFLDTLGDVEPATRDAAAAYPARPVFRCMLARIYQRSGELHQAHAIFDELARDAFAGLIVDPDWLCAVSLLIETGVALEEERSVRVLRDLIRPFEDRVVSNIPEGIRGAAPRYSALAASAYGDWSDADSSFRAAIERNERAGFRPWLALTQYEYAAELLRREGERDHVRKLLDAAHATFVDLRMETHAARAAELQSLVEMVGPSPSGS